MKFVIYDSYGDGLGYGASYKATYNDFVLLECKDSECTGYWNQRESEERCFSPTVSPTTSPPTTSAPSYSPTRTSSPTPKVS